MIVADAREAALGKVVCEKTQERKKTGEDVRYEIRRRGGL